METSKPNQTSMISWLLYQKRCGLIPITSANSSNSSIFNSFRQQQHEKKSAKMKKSKNLYFYFWIFRDKSFIFRYMYINQGPSFLTISQML